MMVTHFKAIPKTWKATLLSALLFMLSGASFTYYSSISDIAAAEEAAKNASEKLQEQKEKRLTPSTEAKGGEESEDEFPESFLPDPNLEQAVEQEPEKTIRTSPGNAHTFVVRYAHSDLPYQIEPSEKWLSEGSLADEEAESASYPIDYSRVLTSSKIIPAVLYTDIHSELPSDSVRAQVEQDVIAYHGWNILIPKGSWIIGRYMPLKHYGNTRLALEWYRAITPEGVNIELSAYTSEAGGQEGISGKLDNKFIEKYGASLLIATINTGAQLSINAESQQNRAIAQALNAPLGDVTQEALRESMQIAPTLEIKKGTRLTIHSAVDLYFPEPKGDAVHVVPLPAEPSKWREAVASAEQDRLEREAKIAAESKKKKKTKTKKKGK